MFEFYEIKISLFEYALLAYPMQALTTFPSNFSKECLKQFNDKQIFFRLILTKLGYALWRTKWFHFHYESFSALEPF